MAEDIKIDQPAIAWVEESNRKPAQVSPAIKYHYRRKKEKEIERIRAARANKPIATKPDTPINRVTDWGDPDTPIDKVQESLLQKEKKPEDALVEKMNEGKSWFDTVKSTVKKKIEQILPEPQKPVKVPEIISEISKVRKGPTYFKEEGMPRAMKLPSAAPPSLEQITIDQAVRKAVKRQKEFIHKKVEWEKLRKEALNRKKPEIFQRIDDVLTPFPVKPLAKQLRIPPPRKGTFARKLFDTNMQEITRSTIDDDHHQLMIGKAQELYDADLRKYRKTGRSEHKRDVSHRKLKKLYEYNPGLVKKTLRDVEKWTGHVGKQYGIEELMLGLIKQESKFDPFATSHSTAAGVGQFIISTWKGMTKEHFGEELDLSYRFNPKISLILTAEHLMTDQKTVNKHAPHLSADARTALTAATYNAGATAMSKAIRTAKKRHSTDKPTYSQIKRIFIEQAPDKDKAEQRKDHAEIVMKNIYKLRKKREREKKYKPKELKYFEK